MNNSLIIGLRGLTLTSIEQLHLAHPWVGGVILFDRNYANTKQLTELTHSIREASHLDAPLISVDQEGGRVQRFKEGFTLLPSAEVIGNAYRANSEAGLKLAFETGQTMAQELTQCGVNMSFSPVVDVLNPQSLVLKGRCFSTQTLEAIELASALIQGMRSHGLEPVLKHFPGHGSVIADTHRQSVTDPRSFDDIAQKDLAVFKKLIQSQKIQNIMGALVTYPDVDSKPACFSEVWLQDILRKECDFTGCIFTDDLGMQAAQSFGSSLECVQAALKAGADKALLCNEFEVITEILSNR